MTTLRTLLALLLLSQAPFASADAAAWGLLKNGGHVAFIRHAITEPGIGDPEGFVLTDCRTQRNLSAQGRADAKAIGDAFRSHAIPVAEVLSSRWCRCLDTARLAFGKITPSQMLDSTFNDPNAPSDEKLRAVRSYAAKHAARGNLVFVTHAQNIQQLTGVSPSSGEIVVTRFESGKFIPVGRIPAP